MESERSVSELTPHWQILRDDKPEVHEFLKVPAEAIYVRGEDRILLSGLDDTGCDAAETDGGQGEEWVAFTDEDVRHDDLARHGALLLREPGNEGSEAFATALSCVVGTVAGVVSGQ